MVFWNVLDTYIDIKEIKKKHRYHKQDEFKKLGEKEN